MDQADRWARRALEHIRVLSKSIGARAATTEGERRAAAYVRDELQRLGMSRVRLEPFLGAVSAWLPWSVAFSIAAWGMLIGLLFRLVGGIIATGLYLLAAWIVYRELYPTNFSKGGYPVRRWLWHADSQNVLGVVNCTGSASGQVVLMSYLDSAPTHPLWRTERRSQAVRTMAPLLLLSLLTSAGAFLLAGITNQLVFYVIALLLLFPQITALIVSIRAGHNPISSGANNNASGVGTLLALAERLKESPLVHTEVWLLATGCRETGGDGARAFLARHGASLTETTFVALEGVGIGEHVVYLTGEGVFWTTSYHPDSLAIAAQAAERCQDESMPVRATRHRGYATEMGIVARSGFKGLTISLRSSNQHSVVGRRHMDDTFETIQKKALSRAHAFAWAFLEEIDRQQ